MLEIGVDIDFRREGENKRLHVFMGLFVCQANVIIAKARAAAHNRLAFPSMHHGYLGICTRFNRIVGLSRVNKEIA